jgi:hypothetical protein
MKAEIHPIRYDANHMPLCRWCEGDVPTGFHEYFACWRHTPNHMREERAAKEQRDLFDREFMAMLKICDPPPTSSSRVTVEIVMSGESVRKAREMHTMRNRKLLMGERRVTGCGQLDLGDIS